MRDHHRGSSAVLEQASPAVGTFCSCAVCRERKQFTGTHVLPKARQLLHGRWLRTTYTSQIGKKPAVNSLQGEFLNSSFGEDQQACLSVALPLSEKHSHYACKYILFSRTRHNNLPALATTWDGLVVDLFFSVHYAILILKRIS